MYRSCRCMYRSARSWAGVILTGSAGGCEPRAEPSEGQAREGEPLEAARAREPVLGRPLRPAPSSEAWPCFWFRVADLFASGLVRASGVRPAWARWQEPAQAPAQQALQALQPRDQALKPRGGPHCQPFLLKDYFIGRSPRKSQRKRWPRGYLRRCRPTSVNLKRRVRRVMGPCNFTKWPSSVLVCIMLPTPLSIIILQMIS